SERKTLLALAYEEAYSSNKDSKGVIDFLNIINAVIQIGDIDLLFSDEGLKEEGKDILEVIEENALNNINQAPEVYLAMIMTLRKLSSMLENNGSEVSSKRMPQITKMIDESFKCILAQLNTMSKDKKDIKRTLEVIQGLVKVEIGQKIPSQIFINLHAQIKAMPDDLRINRIARIKYYTDMIRIFTRGSLSNSLNSTEYDKDKYLIGVVNKEIRLVEKDLRKPQPVHADALDDYIIAASNFLSAVAQTDYWSAKKLNGLKTRILNRIKAQKGKVSSETLLAVIKALVDMGQTDEIFKVEGRVNTKSLVNLFWAGVLLSSDQKKQKEELNDKAEMIRRFKLCLEFMSIACSSDKLKYDFRTDLIGIVSRVYSFWDKSAEENRLLNLKKFIYALVDAGLVDELIDPMKGGQSILALFIAEAKKQADKELGVKQIVEVLYYINDFRELKSESKDFDITPKSTIEETLQKVGLFFGKDRAKISAENMKSVYPGIKAIDEDILGPAGKIDYYLSLFLYKSKLGEMTKEDDQLIVDAFKQTRNLNISALKIINVLLESNRVDLLDALHTDLWKKENRPLEKKDIIELVNDHIRNYYHAREVVFSVFAVFSALIKEFNQRGLTDKACDLEAFMVEDIIPKVREIIETHPPGFLCELDIINALAQAGWGGKIDDDLIRIVIKKISDIPDNKIAERIDYYAELIQALNNAGLSEKIFANNLCPVSGQSIFDLAYDDIMKSYQNDEAAKAAHLKAGIKCFKALVESEKITPEILEIGDKIYDIMRNGGWRHCSPDTLSMYIGALVKAGNIEKVLDKFQVEGGERNLIDLVLTIIDEIYSAKTPQDVAQCDRLYKILSTPEIAGKFPELESRLQKLKVRIKEGIEYGRENIGSAMWKDISIVGKLFDWGMVDELFSKNNSGKNIIQQVLEYIETAAQEFDDKKEAAKYRAESYAEIMPVLFKMLYYWENAKRAVKKPREALSLDARIQKMLPGLTET
ncbi:MAG: hypothetical protein KAI72_08405, partial [Candidatus Pacebacteria bacterium]|nr:hypothetical protein [Candidatus Paceibacterota bacterium]